MARKQPKVAYAVFKGRSPGVYSSWAEAEAQVSRFQGADHKGYTTADGGRAKAEEDFKEYTQRAPVMGNTVSRVVGWDRQADSWAPPKSRSQSHEAIVYKVINNQQPGPRQGSALSVRKSSQRRGSTFLATSTCSNSTRTSQRVKEPDIAPDPEPAADGNRILHSYQKPHIVYPHLLKLTPRKKKIRPVSWKVEHELPRKLQRLGDDNAWSKETVISTTKSGASLHKKPRSFVLDSDASTSEDSCSDDGNGVSSGRTSEGASSSDTSSNRGSSGGSPSVSEVSIPEVKETVVKSGIKTTAVSTPSYAALPGQEQPHNLEAAPDFIPLASSDNGDFSEKTFTRPRPPPPQPTEPELCEEQERLVNLIVSGRNVFFTGSAGCGKSTVLKGFVKRLRDAGRTVQIVAPTGRAAVDIDGTTFWSFAGWHQDSMKKPVDKLAEGARNFKWVNRRLCKTDVLVIDEVSMMENHHFERLDLAMKSARDNAAVFGEFRAEANSRAPFGGVQLVVTGDFCQLPPVLPFQCCLHCGLALSASKDRQTYTCGDVRHGPFLDIDKWAFRSAAWKECGFEHVNLTHIHRQSDREFITILQKMRFGRPLSERDKHLLMNHESETTDTVKLFPLLRQVREVNGAEFARLEGPTISFNCLDNYHWNKEHGNLKNHFTRKVTDDSLDCQDKHRFERRVELKRHMLIILLVNLDISLGLINGPQGIVLGFLNHEPARIPEQVGNHAELKKMQIEEFVNHAET